MGLLASKSSQSIPPSTSPTSSSEAEQQQSSETFQNEVRRSAENFKNLVMNNKVMIFSATYCSYCTVAKVSVLIIIITNKRIFILLFFSEHLTTLAHSSKVWKWTRRARTGRWWWTLWRLWRGTEWCPPSSSAASSSPAAAPASSTSPPPASCLTSSGNAVKGTWAAKILINTASTRLYHPMVPSKSHNRYIYCNTIKYIHFNIMLLSISMAYGRCASDIYSHAVTATLFLVR